MATKSKVVISGRREEDGTHIDLAFSNEEKRSFHLPATHVLYDDFAAHGVGKKVRDAISTAKTAEDAVKAADLLLEAFGKGKWNALRNAADGSPSVGILAHALSRLYGKSLEDAQTFVAGLTKKQAADLRKEPSVAAVIVAMNAESGKVGEGTADLLAAFGGEADVIEKAEVE